jgi:hypothetical protein
MMIIFKIYCAKTFDDKSRYYKTQFAAQHPETGMQGDARSRNDKLASRFGHPALYKPLITPMVHQKAQNLLPSVYRGRLTDGRDGDGADLATISGYSDMYALDSMKGGKPGKAVNAVPGFEYVSDAQMDFQYYKNRAEFAEEHGGGEIYGKGSDIMRSGTPGSFDDVGSLQSISRPASPMLSGAGGPGQPPRRVMTNMTMSDAGYSAYRPSNTGYGPPSDPVPRGQTPLYSHDNGSSSGLVRNAAGMAGPPGYNSREGSVDRGRMTPTRIHSPAPQRAGSPQVSHSPAPGPSVGAMGGGPQGYSDLQQQEEADMYADPTQYNYFRGGSGNRPPRQPGQGW